MIILFINLVPLYVQLDRTFLGEETSVSSNPARGAKGLRDVAKSILKAKLFLAKNINH